MRYEPINNDPDLVQAIEDFGVVVLEIRECSSVMARFPKYTTQWRNGRDAVREKMAGLELRAGRMGLTGAALFQVINAAIDAKARRGRPVPARDTSRTLITNVSNAHARITTAQQQLKEAQAELAAAERNLEAAEAAAAAWGATGKRI